MENENKKAYLENETIKAFLEQYKQLHNGEEYKEKRIGTNGYQVGQEFVLTGEVKFKTDNFNGKASIYWYLPADQGRTELSLATIMGVSSLKGYTNGVTVEYINKDDEKATRNVPSDIKVETFDFKQVWQPQCRNLLELVDYIMKNPNYLKGKKVKFLGTATKPFRAKESGTDLSGERFAEGDTRCIETKLWSVK